MSRLPSLASHLNFSWPPSFLQPTLPGDALSTIPLGAQLPSHSHLQKAIAFVCLSMVCKGANKNTLESVGISWNIREGPWSRGSTRYVQNSMLQCIRFQWFRSSAHTAVTLSPPGLLSPTLTLHTHFFLHFSASLPSSHYSTHHDVTSQQHGPDSAMPQPMQYLEPIRTHWPSLSQHSLLSHKQPTHHTHLQLSPFHHHNWYPHCWPFKSKVSSTWNHLTRPPRTIPTLHSSLSAWSSSSHLSPALPHVLLLKISPILGNERPGLVLKVLFCPPSILHLM